MAVSSFSMAGAVDKPSSLEDSRRDTQMQVQQTTVVTTEYNPYYNTDQLGNYSAFGANFVSLSAQGGLMGFKSGSMGESKKLWAYGAKGEINIHIINNADNTMGLDFYVPLNYMYVNDLDVHNFTFPAYLRPYIKAEMGDMTITPFAQFGAGGVYTAWDSNAYVNWMWGLGGGIEFSFGDFAITPKYMFTKTEGKSRDKSPSNINSWITPEHELSVEFAWRFHRNWAALATGSYIFWDNKHDNDLKVKHDTRVSLGVRYMF